MQLDMARRIIQLNHTYHHSYTKEMGVQRSWALTGDYKKQVDQLREKELKEKMGAYNYYLNERKA